MTSAWPVPGVSLTGYEIHHGRTSLSAGSHAFDLGEPIVEDAGAEMGWRRQRVVGAYLHGILAADAWRAALLNNVRGDSGLPARPVQTATPLDLQIDRWAAHVRTHLREGAWEKILAAVS